MQDGSRMRIKRDHGRNSPDRFCSLRDCANDQLVSKVESIEYAQGQHSGPLNVSVFGSVEEAHQLVGREPATFKSSVIIFHLSFSMFHFQTNLVILLNESYSTRSANEK
jgi:hypothetical protein